MPAVRTYRVNSYADFVIPPKSSFECVMARSPLVSRMRRATILKKYLVVAEPDHRHHVEKIVRSFD